MQAIESHPTIPGASVITIPAFTLEVFTKEVAKLNKKLMKSNALSQFQVVGTEAAQVFTGKVDVFGNKKMLDVFKVTAYIPQLPASDWQLVAILKDDSHQGGEFICTNLADLDAVGMKITCDHCGHNRFRALGFVLRHKVTTEIKTIGSSCIDLYLNQCVEKAIKSFHNWLDSFLHPMVRAAGDGDFDGIDKEWGCGRFRGIAIDTIILAATYAYSLDSKWANSKGAFQEILQDLRFPGTNNKKSLLDECREKYEERAKAVGAQTFAYLRSPEFYNTIDKTTSWGQNLTNCMFHQNGEAKAYTTHAGLVGWAVFKRMENINRAPVTTNAPALVSNYMGNVGEKITVTGEVTLVKYVSSQWGSSTLVNMVSKDGNIASFFSNNGKADGVTKGQVIKVTGKVKKHEEYNNIKRTVLNYTKVEAV